jgi:hypothetical protein
MKNGFSGEENKQEKVTINAREFGKPPQYENTS